MDITERILTLRDHPFHFKTGRGMEFSGYSESHSQEGKITVLLNPHLSGKKTDGLIGTLSCPDDFTLFSSLLAEGEKWLYSQGVEDIYGPINYSTWYANRLMTAGFHHPAFPGEPNNPPHIPQFLEKMGYNPFEHYSTLRHPHREMSTDRNYHRLLKSIEIYSAKGYRFVDIRDFGSEKALEKLHSIMQEIFSQNRFFSPIPFDEFQSIFLPLCNPESPAEIIVSINPQGDISGALVNLYFPHLPEFHTVKSIGVSQKERGAATAHALIASAVISGKKKGVLYTDSALMHRDNMSYRIAQKLGGEILKEYAIFKKPWKKEL